MKLSEAPSISFAGNVAIQEFNLKDLSEFLRSILLVDTTSAMFVGAHVAQNGRAQRLAATSVITKGRKNQLVLVSPFIPRGSLLLVGRKSGTDEVQESLRGFTHCVRILVAERVSVSC